MLKLLPIATMLSMAFSIASTASTLSCLDTLRPIARPASDTDPVQYVLMTQRWPSAGVSLQREILRHIPAGVRPLLLEDNLDPLGPPVVDIGLPSDVLSAPAPSPWVQDYLPEVAYDFDGQPTLVSFQYTSASNREAVRDSRFRSALLEGTPHPDLLPTPHAVARRLGEFLHWPVRTSEFVLQGGHYLAADDGTIFISEDLLRQNAGHSDVEIANELRALLHPKRIVWLPQILGEPTGHLDVYAMPLGAGRVLLQRVTGNYPWNSAVAAAAKRLTALGYQVEYLDSPDQQHLYVNSRQLGNTLFMPVYARRGFFGNVRLDANDQAARARFVALGFDVVPVPARELLDRGGAVHCLTKILPKPLSRRSVLQH